MTETLPECPHCGESGIFDKWVVLNDGNLYARFSCSHCENLFDLSKTEYEELKKNDNK